MTFDGSVQSDSHWVTSHDRPEGHAVSRLSTPCIVLVSYDMTVLGFFMGKRFKTDAARLLSPICLAPVPRNVTVFCSIFREEGVLVRTHDERIASET